MSSATHSQVASDAGSTQRPPEDESSSSKKASPKVSVIEHAKDKRTISRLNPSSFASMNPRSKDQAPISTSPSAVRSRPIQKEAAQRSLFLTVLPHDIHYLLATRYVSFDTLLALRQTCHTLHQLFTPTLVRRVRSTLVKQSLTTESRQYKDYRSVYPRQRLGHLWDLLYAAFDFRLIERPARDLPCYGCLETKPLWQFVERMSNRGTGLGAKSAHDRMCKDCMRRYRDIEGEWWKENWVKKSDTVRKSTKSRRLRRFVLQGGSLVNPQEEIGVCASCGSGTFELWWGCVGCFELEEQRRREEDMLDFDGLIERKIVDFLETWRVRKETKRRKRQASRDRRPRKWYAMPRLNFGVGGNVADRKAALMEWKDNKAAKAPSNTGSNPGSKASPWRALDQISLPTNRREPRCSSCWVPNCPRRTYILGLAYERPLPRERWCQGCQNDFTQRHAGKVDRRAVAKESRGGDGVRDGIFSDEWGGGLSGLFDEE